jgi:hypothetical protein
MTYEQEEDFFITGGADGYIKWWPYAGIDLADFDDDHPTYAQKPSHEVYLGDGVEVASMSRTKDKSTWIITDGQGAIHRLTGPDGEPERKTAYHSGSITGAYTHSSLSLSRSLSLAICLP